MHRSRKKKRIDLEEIWNLKSGFGRESDSCDPLLKQWLEQLEALLKSYSNSDLSDQCKIIIRVPQPYQ